MDYDKEIADEEASQDGRPIIEGRYGFDLFDFPQVVKEVWALDGGAFAFTTHVVDTPEAMSELEYEARLAGHAFAYESLNDLLKPGRRRPRRDKKEGDNMQAELVTELVVEKETKNTIRYEEVVPDGLSAVIGKLYVQKDAIGGDWPQKIRVTIEEANPNAAH